MSDSLLLSAFCFAIASSLRSVCFFQFIINSQRVLIYHLSIYLSTIYLSSVYHLSTYHLFITIQVKSPSIIIFKVTILNNQVLCCLPTSRSRWFSNTSVHRMCRVIERSKYWWWWCETMISFPFYFLFVSLSLSFSFQASSFFSASWISGD